MSSAMRDATTSTPQRQQAAKVKATAQSRIDAVRSNDDLSPEGKRRMIAGHHADLLEQLQQLKADEATETGDRAVQLQRRLFGSSTADPSAVIAARDAADRVASVTDPDTAHGMLDRAEVSGDVSMAKAVAQHAHQMSTGPAGQQAWRGVADRGVAVSGGSPDALEELRTLTGRGPRRGADRMGADAAYSAPAPHEVAQFGNSVPVLRKAAGQDA